MGIHNHPSTHHWSQARWLQGSEFSMVHQQEETIGPLCRSFQRLNQAIVEIARQLVYMGLVDPDNVPVLLQPAYYL